jgi:hypothetical protein
MREKYMAALVTQRPAMKTSDHKRVKRMSG